jgi:hypothetical protein
LPCLKRQALKAEIKAKAKAEIKAKAKAEIKAKAKAKAEIKAKAKAEIKAETKAEAFGPGQRTKRHGARQLVLQTLGMMMTISLTISVTSLQVVILVRPSVQQRNWYGLAFILNITVVPPETYLTFEIMGTTIDILRFLELGNIIIVFRIADNSQDALNTVLQVTLCSLFNSLSVLYLNRQFSRCVEHCLTGQCWKDPLLGMRINLVNTFY